MKTITLLTAISLMLAMTGPAVSADAIDDLNMGLSKTSVFDTPTPAPYAYSDTRPGKNDWLPRAWEGAPPQIPHATTMRSECLSCHDPHASDHPALLPAEHQQLTLCPLPQAEKQRGVVDQFAHAVIDFVDRFGDVAQARKLYGELSDDTTAPAGVRTRAAEMTQILGG